jgi:SAM-dependent methyltransferase
MSNKLYSKQLAEKQLAMYTEFGRQWDPWGKWGANTTYIFDRDGRKIDIKDIIRENNYQSVMDYGCGYGYVVDNIEKEFPGIKTVKYDPFVKGLDVYPTDPCDLVVLHLSIQHVEDEYIDQVVDNLYSLCNDQLIVKNFLRKGGREADWYVNKLSARFKLVNQSFGEPMPNCAERTEFVYGIKGATQNTPVSLWFLRNNPNG